MTSPIRKRSRATFASCVAGLLAAAVLLGSAPAPATQVPVFLGAIGVGRAKPEVKGELRSFLRAELAATDFTRVKSNERYVLAANLVQLDLDSVQDSKALRATCVVSVTLTRESGGTLYALIHGKATAEGTGQSIQSDALRAAVHSAMVRVPKALH